MKIVYTMEEVKNIICDFTQKSIGGDKPMEVAFIHKHHDLSGEIDVNDVAKIDRVEVKYKI